MNIRTLTTAVVPSALLLGTLAAPAEAVFKPIGTFDGNSAFDEGAAEIGAFDAASQRLFVTNGNDDAIDILDLSNPTAPSLFAQVDLSQIAADNGIDFGGINSLDVSNGILAAALEADNAQDVGSVAFFDLDGIFQSAVQAGALPDMLTFTPDGSKVLVANEGEPSSYNQPDSVDPEGSVSIIDLSAGVENLTNDDVINAGFTAFNDQKDALTAAGVRIFGPNASVAQDFEPEYIAVAEDGKTAYVALQENNALGVLDVESGEFTDIIGAGFKDHSQPGNGLDPSDEDDAINIQTVPTLGMYQPDAIATFEADGTTYIATANEGDAREYDGFEEEVSLEDLFEAGQLDLDNDGNPDTLDTVEPKSGETLEALLDENRLGDLDLTSATGDIDGDGLLENLHSFGARSFSIYNAETGEQVFDSGDEFEQIIAGLIEAGDLPRDAFNNDNDENQFDGRSDAKGPEPEAIEIGVVDGRLYAFVGLERIGGVMVYDITNPDAPTFVEYTNNRNFVDFDEDNFRAAGDLGPEDVVFISSEDSPTGRSLLAVTNEVSGTTTVYEDVPEPGTVVGLLALGTAGAWGLKRKRQ